MDKEAQTKEFYERLKKELDLHTKWPGLYLYKFIVPTDKQKILSIQNAFNSMGAVIKTKKSKNGKFTSISIDVMMKDSQEIINKYIEVSTVEGIISL
jgi:putative lipoic acid-binding regulatory protein